MKRFWSLIVTVVITSSGFAQDNMSVGKSYYEKAQNAWSDYERERYYSSALPLLQVAAKDGFGEACYLLGNMYRYGCGTTADKAIAVRMYNRGFEFGWEDGYTELGDMYLFGEIAGDGKVDGANAFAAYTKGTQCGSMQERTQSSNRVAMCYFYGWGIEQNRQKAYEKWDKKVYHNEIPNVMGMIADFYLVGDYVEPNPALAATLWYEARVPSWILQSVCIMLSHNISSVRLNSGGSCSRLEMLEDAVTMLSGDELAYAQYLYALDRCREGNSGWQRSMTAETALSASANGGFAPAQWLLADWYRRGIKLSKNLVKAQELHDKAAASDMFRWQPQILWTIKTTLVEPQTYEIEFRGKMPDGYTIYCYDSSKPIELELSKTNGYVTLRGEHQISASHITENIDGSVLYDGEVVVRQRVHVNHYETYMEGAFIYSMRNKEGGVIMVTQDLFVRFVDVEGNWVG